jgi:hypothetical protein
MQIPGPQDKCNTGESWTNNFTQDLVLENVKRSNCSAVSQSVESFQEKSVTYSLDEQTERNSEMDCLHPLSNYVFSDAYNPRFIRLHSDDSKFQLITLHFKREWAKPAYQCPVPVAVYKIANRDLLREFNAYGHQLRTRLSKSKLKRTPYICDEYHFHGTRLKCNILETNRICQDIGCGVCGISIQGFDLSRSGKKSRLRFGKGIYLAPTSSKCHDYTKESQYGYRAQLLCLVECGVKYELHQTDPSLLAPPLSYHSVHGKAVAGGKLKCDEIVLYNTDAILPQYIIIYTW